MMRLFITGGAGFLGSHVVRRAIEAGHIVTNYDALTQTANLSAIWDLEDHPNYTLIPGAVEDEVSLDRALDWATPHAVIHLAHPQPGGVTAMLQSIDRTRDGFSPRLVTTRTFDRPDQDHDMDIAQTHLWSDIWTIDVTVIDSTYAIGPYQRDVGHFGQMVTQMLAGQDAVLPPNPSHPRTWIAVQDLADCILEMSDNFVGPRAVFATGPHVLSPLQMARHVSRALDKRVPKSDGTSYANQIKFHPSDYQYQDPIAVQHWQGQTEFDEIVDQTLDWALAKAQKPSRLSNTNTEKTNKGVAA